MYILFDPYTSLNNSVYIDVIAYFLDAKKELPKVLLTVGKIHRDHNEKNQTKAIILIIKQTYFRKKTRLFHHQ